MHPVSRAVRTAVARLGLARSAARETESDPALIRALNPAKADRAAAPSPVATAPRFARALAVAFAALALWAAPAAAQGVPTPTTRPPSTPSRVVDNPRAMGMGGAVRGDPVAGSALIYNPAGMARALLYNAEVQYFRDQPSGANAVGVSIVDSRTQESLAVGFGYGYQFTSESAPMTNDGHDVRLAFAHPIVPQQVAMGFGLHYLSLDRVGAKDVDALTMDVGLLVSVSGSFHVGLVGENLIPTDDLVYPRRAGGGLAFVGEALSIDVDVLADFDTAPETRAVFMAGLELLLGGAVPLRGGFEYNGAREVNFLTGGLGFLSGGAEGGFQLNVGYRQNIDITDEFQISAGISLFL